MQKLLVNKRVSSKKYDISCMSHKIVIAIYFDTSLKAYKKNCVTIREKLPQHSHRLHRKSAQNKCKCYLLLSFNKYKRKTTGM